MDNMWILAQADKEIPAKIYSETVGAEETETTTVAQDPNAAPVTQRPRALGGYMWVYVILMFLLLYFILFRGPQKQKQQRKQLVQSLQKNDRVQTIGGIIGTVVDIKSDVVTLKIDESNNTKIKIAPSAIGKNLSKE